MHRHIRIPLIFLVLLTATDRCFAPFIYTPGEGWSYEFPGQAKKWRRDTAKDQLGITKTAYKEGDYKTAVKAAGRVIRRWPLSDYAPEAQHLSGLAYEGLNRYEKAFKAYQLLIVKYPKYDHYDEVIQRQFDIANRFLDGRRFRLWGLFPLFRSMDRTSTMYQQVINNGPYSDIAPSAQLNIGEAREKKKDYNRAFLAYEKAADRYADRKVVSADALFRGGLALLQEAKEAEYDQSIAMRAIEMFNDFIALHPEDARRDQAEGHIRALQIEQARGSLKIARYYNKKRQWQGALTYYNEVVDIFSRLVDDTEHRYAKEARTRIEQLKAKLGTTEATPQ